MKIATFVCVVACLALLAGCGGSSSPNQNQPVQPTLQSITITPSTATLWVALNAQQYKATGIYSDASSKDLTKTVQWMTSSSSIAKIDGNGVALPVGAGMGKVYVAH
jgi:hypothetical protein